MGKYFSRHDSRYNNIVSKIKNKKIKELFKKFTQDSYKEWDDTTYNLLNSLLDYNFNDINWRSKHFKVYVLSEPVCWLLLLTHEDFLNYIDPLWEKLNEKYDEEENEIKQFREIFNYLNEIDNKRFPLK